MAADRVFLEGIEFFGYIGVGRLEREIGQRYRLDLILETDLRRAGQTDDLAATVDYGAVYLVAMARLTRQKYRLLERAAEVVAEAILTEFPQVTAVTVRLRKTPPPIQGVVAAAGVEIRRVRETASPEGDEGPGGLA